MSLLQSENRTGEGHRCPDGRTQEGEKAGLTRTFQGPLSIGNTCPLWPSPRPSVNSTVHRALVQRARKLCLCLSDTGRRKSSLEQNNDDKGFHSGSSKRPGSGAELFTCLNSVHSHDSPER